MCIHHTVILTSLCKWKRPKWLFFVVKRYAVREAKKWRYAVRKAQIERYAVREGGRGVTLMMYYLYVNIRHEEAMNVFLHVVLTYASGIFR